MALWQHQKDGKEFIADKDGALLWWGMGCIAGDTELTIFKDNQYIDTTIEALFEEWNNCGDMPPKISIQSIIDGTIAYSTIDMVTYSGEKDVCKIILESGKTITCTRDHLILTNSHVWQKACNLDHEDIIITSDTPHEDLTLKPKHDKFKRIEHVGIQPTYDITMKDSNNFVANNIVVHNSGKSYASINIAAFSDFKTILILCPKSVVKTWINEFEKHAPGQFAIIAPTKGTVAKKAKEITAFLNYSGHMKPKVVILNYEAAWRPGFGPTKDKWKNTTDIGILKKITWDFIISDEVQKIKSAGSKVSRFVATLKSKKRLALSGTPTPNSPLDIYGIYRFLDKSIFGTSYQRFKMRYAEFGGFENRQVIKYINTKELNEKVYSIAHRVKTEDVVELPDFEHLFIECELNPAARKAYDAFKKEAVIKFQNGEDLTAANVLTKYLRLAQIASGTVKDDTGVEHFVDNSKLEALKDLLLGIDEPVVIFTRFRNEIKQIKEMINGFQRAGERPRVVAELSGSMDERDKFASGEAEIIVVNLQAGGTGVNELVRARYGVYFSTGYSSGDYEQSLWRIRRPGSDINKKTLYYHIIAKNTIDEVIMNAIQTKMDLIEAVLQDFSSQTALNAA